MLVFHFKSSVHIRCLSIFFFISNSAQEHILYVELTNIIPIAIDVSCFPISAARSSTHPLASYPGTEHIKTGVLAFIW